MIHLRTSVTAALSCLALTATAFAQPAGPCEPSGALLQLGKDSFFRSIERGAFAIGERSLDDLTDGLGDDPSAKGRALVRRPRNAAANARAAVFGVESETPLAAPLAAYVESPDSELADRAFNTFLEKATKILFEKIPEKAGAPGSVGMVVEGGQIFNGGTQWAVGDMVNEPLRQKLEQSLFGDGPDLRLGVINKSLGADPFFTSPVIADARNIDRNNIGIEVQKEQQLRDLWFKDYRGHLLREGSALDAAKATEALNAGWPVLQKYWAFKRTEVFVNQAQMKFGTQMREIYRIATSESFRANQCGDGQT